MSADYDSLPSPRSNTSGTGSESAGWRDRLRNDVGGMSYADGAAALGANPVQRKDDPDVHETATETLDAIEGTDNDTRSLCYMENASKISQILEAYKSKLADVDKKAEEAGGAASNTDEFGRLTEIIAFLEYTRTYVDMLGMSGQKRKDARKKMDELAAVAFPNIESDGQGKAAKAVYFLISTQPGAIRRMETPLRGGGVGAALVKMGGGEMIYQEEMKDGKLKPGAPLQAWWGGDYRMRGQAEDETTTLTGKGVYHAISRGTIHSGQGISGHSLTFVRYDAANKNKIYYMQQWNNELDSTVLGGDSDEYLVAANISTGGGSQTSAEHVLMDTNFKADISYDALVRKARRYKLDPVKMAAALVAGIAASEHADRAALQTSAARYGSTTEISHDLVRLVGLWQHAVGISVDGDFGNGSSNTMFGTTLDKAVAIQISQ